MENGGKLTKGNWAATRGDFGFSVSGIVFVKGLSL